MEKKKLQSVSIAALIVSILPLAALAPSLLHLSLSDGVRTALREQRAKVRACTRPY